MSSLRERQKKARSEQILAAARKQFLVHGYSKTNMEAIADEAEVGVATIYTYFESKEGVVKALIEKDFLELSQDAQTLIDSPPKNPTKAVTDLLTIYRRFDEYISYEMMHDFVSQARTKGPVRDAVNWLHDSQVKQVDRILKQSQKAGEISVSLDTKIAAGIVIDLLARHVNRITNETRESKDSKQFYKRIKVLFDNWHA
jgi:AcrR family transcriptional regulator